MTAMVLSGDGMVRLAGRENVRELLRELYNEPASEYDDLECLCLCSSVGFALMGMLCVALC